MDEQKPEQPAARKVRYPLPCALVELDVTPRWFTPGESFVDDLVAVAGVVRDAGSPIYAQLSDFQCGASGVRLVLKVLAGQTVDELEGARVALVAKLDSLDLVSARRRAVTEQRVAAQRRAQERRLHLVQPREGATPAPEPADGATGQPEAKAEAVPSEGPRGPSEGGC